MMQAWTARQLGIACGLSAGVLGLAYLFVAGAPPRMPAMQAAAAAIGLVSLLIITILGRGERDPSAWVLMLLGFMLLMTALFGVESEGAARWIRMGTVQLQPSLILLPPMLIVYARTSGPVAAAGMVLAALALALQPDRAMAGTLAASLAVLALIRPDRWTIAAASCGLAAFVAALAQADTLPAVPYVDRIFYTAFDLHWLAGAAVLAGALIMILPILGGGEQAERLVFGTLWAAIVAAAALGNYPMPLIGYGGSAILGYWLSVAALSRTPRTVSQRTARAEPGPGRPTDPLLRVAA